MPLSIEYRACRHAAQWCLSLKRTARFYITARYSYLYVCEIRVAVIVFYGMRFAAVLYPVKHSNELCARYTLWGIETTVVIPVYNTSLNEQLCCCALLSFKRWRVCKSGKHWYRLLRFSRLRLFSCLAIRFSFRLSISSGCMSRCFRRHWSVSIWRLFLRLAVITGRVKFHICFCKYFKYLGTSHISPHRYAAVRRQKTDAVRCPGGAVIPFVWCCTGICLRPHIKSAVTRHYRRHLRSAQLSVRLKLSVAACESSALHCALQVFRCPVSWRVREAAVGCGAYAWRCHQSCHQHGCDASH